MKRGSKEGNIVEGGTESRFVAPTFVNLPREHVTRDSGGPGVLANVEMRKVQVVSP